MELGPGGVKVWDIGRGGGLSGWHWMVGGGLWWMLVVL